MSFNQQHQPPSFRLLPVKRLNKDSLDRNEFFKGFFSFIIQSRAYSDDSRKEMIIKNIQECFAMTFMILLLDAFKISFFSSF